MITTEIDKIGKKPVNVGRIEKVGFSIKELAEMLPLSEAFFRAEISAGRLLAKTFGSSGSRLCVMKKDLLEYLEKQRSWVPREKSDVNKKGA